MAANEIRFSIWEHHDGSLQMEIGNDLGGYRLIGPKFSGTSELITRGRPLSNQDIAELRRYLNRAEASNKVSANAQ